MKKAMTIKEFRAVVSVGITMLYRDAARGRLEMRKAGKRTLILTSPDEYLASLPTFKPQRSGWTSPKEAA